MQDMGIGAGLAAIAFWMFIAAVVVAGVWDKVRKREAQHETIRKLLESGQKIDEAVVDKLLALGDEKNNRIDEDLRVTGLWLLPVSAGFVVFAFFMQQVAEVLGPILLGIAGLVGAIGIGALISARIAKSWNKGENNGPQSL